ncbi:Alpha/Beta hydrolase protein [Apiospora saccharicola]|uniref:Alpha/Beta hydrolase protein n=1 Tax=Apiospora saccharicola TaxID=335842 RepID=A0ABR1U206_9PEZI
MNNNNPSEAGGDKDLFFVSLNPLAPVTVVMLHVIFSSHLEWVHIWPKLSEYHLMIPDLPQHSRSRHVKPFSFELAADLIADLIRTHAHDGKAHLVGMSTGGYIALEMVRRHPDVVQSAYVSGVSYLMNGWQALSLRYPKIMYLGLTAMLNTPSAMLLKATGWATNLQNEELLREIRKNTTASLSTSGVGDTQRYCREDVVETGRRNKRVAVVAGGKQDHIEGAHEIGRLLRSMGSGGPGGGEDTRTFVVKNGIHVWNLQYPEVFAQSVRAWIEGYPMPMALDMLEDSPN